MAVVDEKASVATVCTTTGHHVKYRAVFSLPMQKQHTTGRLSISRAWSRLEKSDYAKRSNLSFFALQIGQTSGGSSLAQRYPHTLQRQTGRGSEPPKLPLE